MPAQRLSKDKRALVLAILSEGTPINAVCRTLGVAKETVLRIIAETGEALAHYMSDNFRGLPCSRLELDEQWQYVGIHGQRMVQKEKLRGDFWLWCAVDPDSKLVVTYRVGRRDWQTGEEFVADLARRVVGPVQIATDNHLSYANHIRAYFGYAGASHGTETKVFGEPKDWNPTSWQLRRTNGVPKVAKSTRKAVLGSPSLRTITTSHIERVFLSVRQELTRLTRQTLGYSKDLRMHRLSVAMYFGIYNLVRKHKGIDGQTPAQAAGLEDKRWTLLDVVEMTEKYWKPRLEAADFAKAAARRIEQDAVFLRALAQ